MCNESVIEQIKALQKEIEQLNRIVQEHDAKVDSLKRDIYRDIYAIESRSRP